MVMIMRAPSLKPIVSSCMCVCDGKVQNLNRLCRSQIRTDARINLLGGGKGGQLRANLVFLLISFVSLKKWSWEQFWTLAVIK